MSNAPSPQEVRPLVVGLNKKKLFTLYQLHPSRRLFEHLAPSKHLWFLYDHTHQNYMRERFAKFPSRASKHSKAPTCIGISIFVHPMTSRNSYKMRHISLTTSHWSRRCQITFGSFWYVALVVRKSSFFKGRDVSNVFLERLPNKASNSKWYLDLPYQFLWLNIYCFICRHWHSQL